MQAGSGGGAGGGEAKSSRFHEQFKTFSLRRLREEVVLRKSEKARRCTLDGGLLKPEECLSYMRAVIDRVVELQQKGDVVSEQDDQTLDGIKDAIFAQLDVMSGGDISEDLALLKKKLLADLRAAIKTPKADASGD